MTNQCNDCIVIPIPRLHGHETHFGGIAQLAS